ncbi:NAD-dependent epimerase/dehydratase family protein [Priestia aryabhattai]|uniref:NAD-dependent epimerase/dehydratase family protein n=1 Tax=Priestia aryabhattai TaxID=412384 RepID=UPI001F0B119B|nr:NAD-dependent epimerase/dehydratase family protein [Priestia aryabhattai]
MVKVLITGGAGFIGSHIVEKLLQEGYQVIVVDNLSTGNKSFLPKDIPLYTVDIQSSELHQVFKKEKPEIVIHAAAQVDVNSSINNPQNDASINILGTINLLNCCHKHKVQKIIYSSSCAVYGVTEDCSVNESFPISPLSFYGISKSVAELYMKAYHSLYNLNYTVLRYANVYGPKQSILGEGGVVSIFCKNILKKEDTIIYGNGQQTRDFVFVKDVAEANIRAITKGEQQIINIGCNKKTSIKELYQLLLSLNSILFTTQSPIYQPKRQGDILHSRLENTKAKIILNWEPNYTLREGLEETMNYYRNELSI